MTNDYNSPIYKEGERIYNYLRNQEYPLIADVYPHSELPVIQISIYWGDWKHDHARCDYLMEKLGYILISEQTTESDGSDCYSSIHNYLSKDYYNRDEE